MLTENTNDLWVALPFGNIKWSITFRVLYACIGPLGKEHFDDIHMTLSSGKVKGRETCIPSRASRVDISTFIQEVLNDMSVPYMGGTMQISVVTKKHRAPLHALKSSAIYFSPILYEQLDNIQITSQAAGPE
jgi:hypothetical protein